jgi:ATP-dependent DNA ligase
MLSAVRDQGLEGIVGKRKDSVYEPGKRSGAWIKYRVNLGQEFVIGGFTPGPHGLDALIVGYYRGDDLVYVARTRNGFVPASRRRAANWTTSERSHGYLWLRIVVVVLWLAVVPLTFLWLYDHLHRH